VHNVDVISTIDVGRMVRFHAEHDALATMAVQRRETSRALLFDRQEQLRGRQSGAAARADQAKTQAGHPANGAQLLAFCGIHVISSRIFSRMEEQGAFSIIDTYLRLAAEGEKIVAFRADVWYWRDLGRPESVLKAAQDHADGKWT
jgi:NDP-sugar pyrophosphorylase family protein